MARTVTRSALRDRIRAIGEINDNYVTDAQMNDWIEQARLALYELITNVSPDWFMNSVNITVVSGTDIYDVDANAVSSNSESVYKVRGADIQDTDTSFYVLERFNWGERNTFTTSGSSRRLTRYRVIGPGVRIRLHPTPSWSGTIRVWYIPLPVAFSSDNDTMDAHAAWDDWVAGEVLLKYAARSDLDPSNFLIMKQEAQRRIESAATSMDEGGPDRVRDREMERVADFYYPNLLNP